MARFTRESVDRVKEAVDIVEVVSAHTDLQQRGQDYWGNCPFHDERTPSFKVNPRDKLYYCFGCEASGDVFRFVEEKEGLDFASAVESLAERSEEHTSELQSLRHLVCRLLLEKK